MWFLKGKGREALFNSLHLTYAFRQVTICFLNSPCTLFIAKKGEVFQAAQKREKTKKQQKKKVKEKRKQDIKQNILALDVALFI